MFYLFSIIGIILDLLSLSDDYSVYLVKWKCVRKLGDYLRKVLWYFGFCQNKSVLFKIFFLIIYIIDTFLNVSIIILEINICQLIYIVKIKALYMTGL